MTLSSELILTRDTTATIIPAGEEQVLKAGTSAVISQALGGTVTIRTDCGLFRLAAEDWDALGESAVNTLNADVKTNKASTSQTPHCSEHTTFPKSHKPHTTTYPRSSHKL